MAAFGSPLPWLDKATAMRHAAELIIESALLVGGFVGYLDYGSGSEYWVPPRGGRRLAELRQDRLPSDEFSAPADSLERTLAHLAEHRRSVTSGSFVFVLSDFLPLPSEEVWLAALEHRWDLVPIVIQDPMWEQSFPDVSGIVVPLREPGSRHRLPVRLKPREVELRRAREPGSAPGARRRVRGRRHRSGAHLDERPRRHPRRVPRLVGAAPREAGGVRAALVACVLALAAVAAGSAHAAEPPPDVETSLTPEILLFGDTMTARVDVLVNKRRMNPDSVHVQMDFTPWSSSPRWSGSRRTAAPPRSSERRSCSGA